MPQPTLTVAALAILPMAFDPTSLAGQLAPSALAQYVHDVRSYLAFAGTPEAVLDPATLARWRAQLSSETALSVNTINHRLAAVKRMMQAAAAHGYISQETAQAFRKVAGG